MTIFLILTGGFYAIWIISLVIYQWQLAFFETKKTKQVFKFSIVIPFKNEAKNLPRLINSLQKTDYPADAFEIIMIDDHSDDNSYKIVENQQNILLIKNKKSGKKQALKTGIAKAQYEWIISIDADCELLPDYLHAVNSFIAQHQPEMILGPVRYFDTDNFLGQFQQFEFLCLQALTMVSAGLKKPFLANGANLIFRKQSFEAVRGYEGNLDIASGDDVFLLQKFARKFPGKIHFIKSRSAIVKTQSASNWNELIQQKIRWAGKSKNGGQTRSKILGILMMLVHIGLLYAMFNYQRFYWFIAVKFIVDALCLYQTNRFYRASLLWRYYPLSFVVYPFYLVIVFVLALRGSYRWKNYPSKSSSKSSF